MYTVEVTKDGFVSWHETLRVESSSINLYDDVVLFRSNPIISDVTDTKKIAQLEAPEDILANTNNDFSVRGYEIWIGDQLTTRLSTPVLRAIRYTDMSHVVYQQRDEIRIIENNGKNDTLLVKLSSPTATKFVLGARGTELYYIDGEVNKMAVIR
jgi:hypothetical protein